MTGDPDNLETHDNEPIDADFIPAPDPVSPKVKRGPGWLSLGLATMIAAGTGGAVGLFAGDISGGSSSSGDMTQITEDFEVLQSSQTQIEKEINRLTRNATELENRLKKNIEDAIVTNGGAEEMTAMIEELNAVSERLETNIGASLSPEDLATLTQRLDALESAGSSDEATPEDVRRGLAALDERFDRIEAATDELKASIESRQTQMDSLTERLTETEFGLEDIRTSGAENNDGDISSLKEEIASLRVDMETLSTTSDEDVEALKTVISEIEQTESEELAIAKRAEQRAEAVLALSALETGSQSGASIANKAGNLAKLFPNSEPMLKLAKLSKQSVPSLSDLTDQFAEVKSTIETKAKEDSKVGGTLGWLDEVFGDAVKVEKSGATKLPDIVLEAERALAGGDIPLALNAIRDIPSKDVYALFQGWEKNAAQYVEFQESLRAARDVIKQEADR